MIYANDMDIEYSLSVPFNRDFRLFATDKIKTAMNRIGGETKTLFYTL